MQNVVFYRSPLGMMLLAADGVGLTGAWFEGQKYFGSTLTEGAREERSPVTDEAVRWLDLYFSGAVPDFLPPLHLTGSPFRREVWALLCAVPYGETVTYGELAARLRAKNGGRPVSARAVGGAVGHNPVSVIVPCRRVTGAGGRLTGYAGGLERKRQLLRREQGLPFEPFNGGGSPGSISAP